MSVVCAKFNNNFIEIAADSALSGNYDRYNKYLEFNKVNSFVKSGVNFVVGSVGHGNAICFLKNYFDSSDFLNNLVQVMVRSKRKPTIDEKNALQKAVYAEVVQYYRVVSELTGRSILDEDINEQFVCESILCFFSPKTKKPYVFCIDEFIITSVKKDYAIGSGAVHAQSLLDHGHTIGEAIRAACERSVECYMPINKYTIYKTKTSSNVGQVEFTEVE